MLSLLRSPRTRSLSLCILISLTLLAGCALPKTHLIVGGKLDTEAKLLTEMYVLLLRHAGFDVEEKAALGTNDDVLNALTKGKIDLYPEFTGTGLAKLGLHTTGDSTKDYQTVKNGFESKYQITWLDKAPLLNDTYGICTLKSTAEELGITRVAQLRSIASRFILATPKDGTGPVDALKSTYGIDLKSFKQVNIVDEALSFSAVIQDQAQFNVCYTTSALIVKNNFVLLSDKNNGFPIDQPAPIVRDDTLQSDPAIATALNPLSFKLTNQVSTMLQGQVNAGFSVTDVATVWLKSQGLL